MESGYSQKRFGIIHYSSFDPVPFHQLNQFNWLKVHNLNEEVLLKSFLVVFGNYL
jgi:hypothetical protein